MLFCGVAKGDLGLWRQTLAAMGYRSLRVRHDVLDAGGRRDRRGACIRSCAMRFPWPFNPMLAIVGHYRATTAAMAPSQVKLPPALLQLEVRLVLTSEA